MNNICTAIVTYNRLDLLKDAISSIKSQLEPTDIVVINNGSTDGTKEYLEKIEGVKIINQDNCGGAGGFFTALKFITENGYEFAWIMDDDIVAYPDTLKNLYESYLDISKNEEIGFLCSTVLSQEGETVNVPKISLSTNSTGYADWNKYLDRGYVKVEIATFVSVFLSTQIIKKVGLPLKEYFIWGDDSEYTKRISSTYPASYLVGSSKILHLRNGGNLNLNFINDPNRIKLFKNFIRNNLTNRRKYESFLSVNKFILAYLLLGIRFLFTGKFRKLNTVIKGIISGLFWNPQIEFPIVNEKRN